MSYLLQRLQVILLILMVDDSVYQGTSGDRLIDEQPEAIASHFDTAGKPGCV